MVLVAEGGRESLAALIGTGFCWVNQSESYGKWLGNPIAYNPGPMCS